MPYDDGFEAEGYSLELHMFKNGDFNAFRARVINTYIGSKEMAITPENWFLVCNVSRKWQGYEPLQSPLN
jgi:hypothetical protein